MSERMADRIAFFVFGAGTALAFFLLGFAFDHVTNWIGWRP